MEHVCICEVSCVLQRDQKKIDKRAFFSQPHLLPLSKRHRHHIVKKNRVFWREGTTLFSWETAWTICFAKKEEEETQVLERRSSWERNLFRVKRKNAGFKAREAKP